MFLQLVLPVKLTGRRLLWHGAHASVRVHWLLPRHMCVQVADASLMVLKKKLSNVTLPETANGVGG